VGTVGRIKQEICHDTCAIGHQKSQASGQLKDSFCPILLRKEKTYDIENHTNVANGF